MPVRSITITQEAPVAEVLGTFTQDRVILGKGPGCDVRFSGVQGISGQHAILEWRDGKVWVTDPGARNPVRANGEVIPLRTSVAVTSGTRIQLAQVVLVIEHRP